MASNLKDPSRGYGWRVKLRITISLAAQLRPAEEAWWRLIKQANRLSNEPGAVTVTPDRDAFYILAARDFNTTLIISLYAIMTLALWHFINYQLHALARILSMLLIATAQGKIGLNMACSREQ
ncbi:hypothetical protein LB504_009978 [Fusarium proliferatum]|nr:hypothetical protein LB504_009978 [Fusarium proliferatum]